MSDAIVRATCPSCGDVVLTTRDIGLRLDQDQARFLFTCPRCHEPVTRDVPAGIVHILQAAGVQTVATEPELLSAEQWDAFLADFDQVDCLAELRRLGA